MIPRVLAAVLFGAFVDVHSRLAYAFHRFLLYEVLVRQRQFTACILGLEIQDDGGIDHVSAFPALGELQSFVGCHFLVFADRHVVAFVRSHVNAIRAACF